MVWWWIGAAVASDALRYSGVRAVEHGKAVPYLEFEPSLAGNLEARLTCGGRSWSTRSTLEPGRKVQLRLEGIEEGTWLCSGEVTLTTTGGEVAGMPLSVSVASLPQISWTVDPSDLNLAGRELTGRPDRSLKTAELLLIGVGGAELERVSADLSQAARPAFRWTTHDEVVKLVLEASDEHGFRSQLVLSPWSYSVPHEDVVFATGSAEIAPGEVPKLEHTWAELQSVLERYGSVVEVQLFVGGFTDTVGSPASNVALSEQRARSIAAWYRRRGFNRPIYYQGFGEEGLAVATPDETEQAANRRAVYVLAAEPPPVSESLPRANWRPL